MVTTVTKKATYADYEKTPEGAKYQLIEGQLIEMASPTLNHQEAALELAAQILLYCKQKKIGKIYIAPMDVYLDDENCYQPDIVFVSNENSVILQGKNIRGVPDMLIEILSESSEHTDRKIKFHNYEKFGVKEYFIVDPEDKEVIAYDLVDGFYKERYRKFGYVDSVVLGKRFDF